MDTLALMRGLDDHPSSEDDAPRKNETLAPPRTTSNARARKPSGGLLEAPADPHDLLRGITEDRWSSDEEEESARPVGGSRTRMRSAGARQRIGSTSRERLPVGDPHDLVRGLTEDHPSSDESPPAARTRNRLSSGAANRSEKPGGDPHDLIRGLTEDRWSSSDEEPQTTLASNTVKKPSLSVSHHRPSSTSRPDKPIGDPHDILRGLTEDVWSSEDEPAPSATRKASTSSKKGAGTALGPRKDSATSPKRLGTADKKDGLAPKKSPTPIKSPVKTSSSVVPLLPVGPTSPSKNQPPVKVLFVCLGNICEWPLHRLRPYPVLRA
jgi:hypothetical protein